VIQTFILNNQLISLLWPILLVLPSQLLSLISIMPVLIALIEIPFLPAIMIYLPNSALLIMILTAIIGTLGATNLYVNYKFFETNGFTIYIELGNLIVQEFNL